MSDEQRDAAWEGSAADDVGSPDVTPRGEPEPIGEDVSLGEQALVSDDGSVEPAAVAAAGSLEAHADLGSLSAGAEQAPLGQPGAPSLDAALEAVLLVADEAIPSSLLAQVLDRPVDEVEASLSDLARGYEERGSGFDLRCVAGGWRFYTREDCAPYVERFVLDGQQARLTQAALETLAVIAYREPVTRSRVSAVRGVNVDGVVRTLVARGLVAEAGHDPSSGAVLYATTPLFLERLGIQSRDDLPSLAPLLPELAELDDDSTSS